MLLLDGLLSLVRRILLTDKIFGQCQELQHLRQRQIALENRLQYLSTDRETVKATTAFKRAAEIVSLLSPRDVEGGKYIRVGKDHDGGYVMLDAFRGDPVTAAYSFGIGDDVSWEKAMAACGFDIFMYDHTISQLPKRDPRFHFHRLGITGQNKADHLKTLNELLAENNHAQSKDLIMKMDIEGSEWDVFRQVGTDVIDQFSQIIIEFHGLLSAVYESKVLTMITDVLKKINQTHASVHVHANLQGSPVHIGGLVIPDILEVTYVRHTDGKHKFCPNTRQFPTELDQPTFPRWPDLYLGAFACEKAVK